MRPVIVPMKFLSSHIPVRWWQMAAVLLLAAPQWASAQLPSLKGVMNNKDTPKQEIAEKPEEARARLEQWLKDAHDTLTRLENPTLPADIGKEEIENRRHDLERMVMAVTRSLKSLAGVADARKGLEDARAADAAWSGFKERPPYSLLMIDELLNERDAIKANLSSYEASLANYERLLAGLMTEAKAAEGSIGNAIIAVKKARDDEAPSAKWRLEAARETSRMLAARAELDQYSCAGLKDRIAAARIDLALIERKVALAQKDSRFNEEDLEKVSKLCEERKNALRKEIDATAKRLKAAQTIRTQAQSALDTLTATPPPAPDAKGAPATPGTPGNPPAGLELAKFRLEVAEGRVDAMQSLVEGLESLIQLENVIYRDYQSRRAYLSAATEADKRKSLAVLSDISDRLIAWESVLGSDISSVSADLSRLETRASAIFQDDPQFNLINDQRAAKSEKLTMLQRLVQAVGAERKLVQRWVADYTPKPGDMAWTDKVSGLGVSAWDTVEKIWSLELMSTEETVVLDGKTIPLAKFPITLGMVLRAILFFAIGYWVMARIANRIETGVVKHGHIAEAQAKTLRNWAMIVVGVSLALGTLSLLKIPLTAFAFFGGALAIGLGFGMQTLIKNFISGIIVLVERKVRVGDLVEVEGYLGRITEINTRSSVVCSGDDVEMMVPNSLFLENRVTNWTLTSGKVRQSVAVGVAYGTNAQDVAEVLTKVATRHGLVSKDPAPYAIFEDFGESALRFRLYYWLDLSGTTSGVIVASDLRFMIEKQFTELNIGMPFPHRELRLSAKNPLQVHWAKMPEEDPP